MKGGFQSLHSQVSKQRNHFVPDAEEYPAIPLGIVRGTDIHTAEVWYVL